MLSTRSKTRVKVVAGIAAAVAVCSVNGTVPSASAASARQSAAPVGCAHIAGTPWVELGSSGCGR